MKIAKDQEVKLEPYGNDLFELIVIVSIPWHSTLKIIEV
jgi:hypothetical protein